MARRSYASVLLLWPRLRLAHRLRLIQHAQQQLCQRRVAGVCVQRAHRHLRLGCHLQYPRIQGFHYGREVHWQVSGYFVYKWVKRLTTIYLVLSHLLRIPWWVRKEHTLSLKRLPSPFSK